MPVVASVGDVSEEPMIKSWRRKGLETFFFDDNKAGIRPHHAPRLRRQSMRLEIATSARDMNVAGWKLHGLHGDLHGHCSVRGNGNWRLIVAFDGDDAILWSMIATVTEPVRG
ncbi:MAG: Endoribonuclease HigB [Burkholderia gladioli]|nr:MAG: Endoribonuclease HigB [Burkholderia gladioli]